MLKVWKSYMKSMTKLRVINGQGYRVQEKIKKMWQRYLEYFLLKTLQIMPRDLPKFFSIFVLKTVGDSNCFRHFNHTTWVPYTLENSFFALKTHRIFFCLHYAEEIWKSNNYRSVWISSGRELTWLSWWHRFRAASYSNVFRPELKRKAGVFEFLRFEKLTIRDWFT